MPYIKQEDRERYSNAIDHIMDILDDVADEDTQLAKGHHNYVMFMIAKRLSEKLGVRYATLQDIMGTFECCKDEFYRRIVAKIEDDAIERNGDI